MSWNAAKRALALGYKNVAWYPDGTDGWEAAGLPLHEAKPEPASVSIAAHQGVLDNSDTILGERFAVLLNFIRAE